MNEKILNLTVPEKALVDHLFSHQMAIAAGDGDAECAAATVADMKKIKRSDYRRKFNLSEPAHADERLTEAERAVLDSVARKLRAASARYERRAVEFVNRVGRSSARLAPIDELPVGILGDPHWCALAQAFKPLAEDLRGDCEPETNIPNIEVGATAGVICLNDLPVVQLTLSRDVRHFVELFDEGEYPHLVKDCRANRWLLGDYYERAMRATAGEER